MNHPDRDKYDLSSLTDIAAGGAPRPVSHVERLQQEFPERPAGARLRPDRDQRRRLQQFLGQLCRQAGLDRPRAARRSSSSRSSAPATRICRRRARRDRDPLGRQYQAAIGATRKRPRRPSPPTAMSAPATSAISTRTAICSSSTARRTSSSAAARISRRPRSRPPATPAPTSPRRAVFGVPDERLGEVPVAIVYAAATAAALDEAALRAFLEPRLAAFKIPARMIFSTSRCRGSAPARSTGSRSRRSYAQLNAGAARDRPPDPADRRRCRRRPGRRLRAWPRGLGQRARDARRRAGVRPFPQDRPRRAGHRRGAAGRDRAGRLDRAAADRRRRAWRGVGDGRGRAGAADAAYANPLATARAGSRFGRCGCAVGDRRARITAGSTSVRAFEQPLREAGGDRAGAADRGRGRPLGRRRRANATPPTASSCTGAQTLHLRRAGRGSRRARARRESAAPRRPAQGAADRPAAAAARPCRPRATAASASPATCACPTCCSPSARMAPPGGRLTGFSNAARARAPGVRQIVARDELDRGRRRQLVGGRARAQGRQPALRRRRARRARRCAPLFEQALDSGEAQTLVRAAAIMIDAVEGSRPLAATYWVAPAQHLGARAADRDRARSAATGSKSGRRPRRRSLARARPREAAGVGAAQVTLYPMPVGEPARPRARGRRDRASRSSWRASSSGRSSSACRQAPARTTTAPRAGALARMTRAARRGRHHRGVADARSPPPTGSARRSRALAGERRRRQRSAKPRSTARSRLMRSPTSRVDSVPVEPCRSRPATCAARRSARWPSSPKASSTSSRGARGSSRWRSGWRCSAAIRGSRAACQAAAALGGWDGGGARQHAWASPPARRSARTSRLLAEASIGDDQRIEVHRLVAAVDCGRIVNPRARPAADRGRADLRRSARRPSRSPNRVGRHAARAAARRARPAAARRHAGDHGRADRRATSAPGGVSELGVAAARAGGRQRDLRRDRQAAAQPAARPDGGGMTRPPTIPTIAAPQDRRAAGQPRHARRARRRRGAALSRANS